MTIKALNSILVKPAGPDCNLACSYCFYSCKSDLFPGNKTHRMSGAILTEMIRQLMTQSGNSVGIGWQGGEPTLMGLSFFQAAVELICRFGQNQTVGNGLQTNGLLVDKDWSRFLRKYDFLVGLSIDGPGHVHDRYRLTRDGSGTWSAVVDKAKLLLDEGVCVNALSVVTDYAADFPEETYAFFKGLGLNHMQFIPCVERDPLNPGELMPFSVSADTYGSFLSTLFDLWISDFVNGQPTTSVRFFDSLFCKYIGMAPPECTLLDACGTYLVVEHNGDVYSCDFFVEPAWCLGNIGSGQLKDMLNSQRQAAFGSMKENVSDTCKACRWLNPCSGGCTRNRLLDPHRDCTSYLCKAYKKFFEHADARLTDLASRWLASNSLAQ